MKITIAACGYGAGNIGDEAILSGLKNLLKGHYQDLELTVMSINPQVTTNMHSIKSIAWMNYTSFRSIIKYMKNIKESDLILFGGATLGDDTYGIGYPILSTSMMILFAKILRKKTGMVSIGVNNFETYLGPKLVKIFYGSTDFLMTRDQSSLKLLQTIGINKNKIFETADAAYALEPIRNEMGIEALQLRGIDTSKKLVAISVLSEVYQGFDYKEKIAHLCDYLIEKYDYTPIFINHEVRVGMDQDATVETISHIKNKTKVKILSTEFYSPELMTSMLKQFEFTMGMRMHILILSVIAKIPVVGISRVDKVDNFFTQLDLDTVTHIKNFDLDKIIFIIDDIILHRKNYIQKSEEFVIQKKEDLNRTLDVLKKV